MSTCYSPSFTSGRRSTRLDGAARRLRARSRPGRSTRLQKGFIRAEVIAYDDLFAWGLGGAREQGKLAWKARTNRQGRRHPHIRFNI
jgi:Tfp pilus assembly protein FimT